MKNTIRKLIGYGVSIRNVPPGDITRTIAYQELKRIGLQYTDIVIDVVRADGVKRPKLEQLINTLDPRYDRIVMFSIDTLLLGVTKKTYQYFDAIIQKGIDLLIFDFAGSIVKTSPYSTLKLVDKGRGEISFRESFDSLRGLFFSDDYSPRKNSGFHKTEKRLDINDAFKEIYFAYESYQINQATTMELLREFCSIGDIATFWNMARDFETSLEYPRELSKQHLDILDLPKRCGGIPEEYYQIISYEDEYINNTLSEEKTVLHAMEALNMFPSYDIFRRWKLLAEKKPKPRKPKPYNFDISEFRKKYSNPQQ